MGVRSCGKKKLSSIALLTLPEICLSLLLSHMFHLLGNGWTRQLCRNLKIEVNNTHFNWKQEKSICSLFNTSLILMYSYLHKNFNGAQLSLAPYGTSTFPIMHLIPPPPQILHNLCFSFLLGITAVPRLRAVSLFLQI